LVARSQAGLLIVDEPTKGLDVARRAEIVAMLAGLRDAGRAVLVITHDLELVRGLGGQLAVLEGGEITEVGVVANLLATPRSRFLLDCLDAEPARWGGSGKATFGATVASADRLVVARGRRRLAGPVSLDLRQGGITALLGASGVGKTTLGDTLLGLEPVAEGQVHWLGETLDRRARRRLRPRFQKLHQDPTSVFPARRTFGDGLADLSKLAGAGDVAGRVKLLLEQLRVSPDLLSRRPGEVSGGEAQRLALARLLAVRPALLVADEPGSRLDMPTQAETMRLLRSIADDAGLAVLLITHDTKAANAIADHRLSLEALQATPGADAG
jgi:peptide/nickel transport system ATP-binding protein